MQRSFFSALFLSAAMLVAGAAHATDRVDAPGKAFYKDRSGAIVQRDVTLSVPARGQGQVILKWNGGEFAAESFSSRKEGGRTIFTVNFRNVPYAPAGTDMSFRGTYERGTNMALYYGDIFARTNSDREEDWAYTGGFVFKAEIR